MLLYLLGDFRRGVVAICRECRVSTQGLVLEGCCLRPSCHCDPRAPLFLTLSPLGVLLGPQKGAEEILYVLDFYYLLIWGFTVFLAGQNPVFVTYLLF